ncbi:MAG: tRNA threonylcarbamoyladenosine dehydratase [Methylotenera sp.]|nr:tRNA threonylcarbamoyladenosine dehydratase [Oligoflexia bacterium]
MTEAELETYKLHRRFDRMGRLIGDVKMKKLMDSHVMIIGLGGVGSWAAEMIVRSGVGRVTIVDFDEICVTNFNRQLHAVQGMVGQQKADVLAERFRKINPQSQIVSIAKFYNADSCEEIFADRPDYVIDAIDNITAKCHLLNFCVKREIPVVCSTGSGGRMDPTRVQIKDLSETEIDPLARAVRKILRQQYDFPEKGSFGIPSVFSQEPATAPIDLHYDGGKGFRCVCPQGDNEFFNCDSRNMIMGNAGFVTGSFGMACAGHVVKDLIAGVVTS